MPYRVMPQPKAVPPPRKWPYRLALAGVLFATISCGFMMLVEFGANVDGPGVGYGRAIVVMVMAGAAGGLIGTLTYAQRWPWARSIGLPAGAIAAIAFIGLRGPIHILHASWRWSCDHGDGVACHGLGDERRGCDLGYSPSCSRLIDERGQSPRK